MSSATRKVGVLAGITGLALAACSSTGSTDGAGAAGTDGAIKIGVIISTSGIYAGLGKPEVDALKAYEKNQPADARKIEFVFENDQSDPAQGAAIAQRLVADPSIVGLIAGATSAVANGIFPVAQGAKVPWIVITPNPYPNYNQEPFIFGPNLGPLPNHGQLHTAMLKLDGVNDADAAVLVNDDASGQATEKAFSDFSHFVPTPATLTDYAPVIAKIKSDGRRAIVNNQSGLNAGYARKAQLAAGLGIPFLGGPQVLTESFVNIVGKDAEGVQILALRPMLGQQPPGTDPAQAKQIDAYRTATQAYTKRDPSFESAGPINVWDAALSFGYAAKDLSGVTRAKLQQKMINQEYTAAGGQVKRSSTDHNGFQQNSWIYAQLRDGKVTAVAEMRNGQLTSVAKQ